ncbi:MAG: HAD hydrolase-like protein [Anaerolineae bacterium]|nr:HAD hydrolase-like protein [Anaerolineae bacterium]
MFDVIAFDADDTLWHTEGLYSGVQDKFKQLLAPYSSAERVEEILHQTEMRNLAYYGYGIKGFALSLIEAAIALSEGRIAGPEIQRLIDLAKEMVTAEVRLLAHAQETVAMLAASYPLMVITKGDLFDQEAKIARSGLRPYFRYVEIVSDKTRDHYAAILAKYRLTPARFLMVGNSLRSDILPVVALGGRAVHIPYHITWAHEDAIPADGDRERYVELAHLGLLPALVKELGRA